MQSDSDDEANLSSLVRAINEGQCVVLVGAGLTAPVSGTWRDLLFKLADSLDEKTEDRSASIGVQEWLGSSSGTLATSADYEAAAQFLRDRCAEMDDDLDAHVAHVLRRKGPSKKGSARAIVDSRKRMLLSIPFRAVLTLNFDNELHGPDTTASPSAYHEILRGTTAAHRWYQPGMPIFDAEEPVSPSQLRPVMKLHGSLGSPGGSVVLSWRDYGERLYRDPAYMTFLRALMSTHTFLYLGFSFTDTYLNELRRELMTVFNEENGEGGLLDAYAVLPDVSPHKRRHLLRHEGIKVISYPVRLHDGKQDHSGFDATLARLSDSCSPGGRLRALYKGCRILWLDPNPRNNSTAFRVLGITSTPRDVLPAGDQPVIRTVRNVSEATRALMDARERGAPYDLVVTHWGHDRGTPTHENAPWSVAEELLSTVSRDLMNAPVIVFCSPGNERANRERALRYGAFDLATQWFDLFAAMERCRGVVLRR